MNRIFLPVITVFCVCVLSSCEITGATGKEAKDTKTAAAEDNIVRKYYPNGNIKAEIAVKDRKRHGLSKTYYESGVVRQSIEYADNKKNGEARTNYESGDPYQITRYVDDKKQGIRELYRQNGMLMSEIPYHDDRPCAGVKEYLLDGSPKKKYPTIRIREEDHIALDNTFRLYVTLSEESRNVKFYMGQLTEGGCIGSDTYWMKEREPGLLVVNYEIPPGMFMMEELNFIVTFETLQGNTYFTQKKYNLAIENRGI